MSSATSIAPSQDPWYKPPSAYKTTEPGSILRLRVASGFKPEEFPQSETVYNLLFATTDSYYQSTWGVTTIFVPKVPKQNALRSYQATYNTVSVDHVPSALAHRLSDYSWTYQIGYINAGLECGWLVNYPDHEGSISGFGNGVTTGHTLLDSIRAVLNAGLGLNTMATSRPPRIGLWGFSGAAFASAWAAQLQPQYAPELSLAGVALGGLPPDLRCLADLSGTAWAAVLPVTLLGVCKEVPAAHDFLVSQLKSERRDRFLSVLHTFIDDSVRELTNEDIWAYFRTDREFIMTHPLMRKAFARAQLGFHGVPDVPLFVYQSVNDKNTPIANTNALVKRWGDLGVNVHFERNSLGDHVQEMAHGKQRAIDFFEATLGGTYTHEGVTVADVAVVGEETGFDPHAVSSRR